MVVISVVAHIPKYHAPQYQRHETNDASLELQKKYELHHTAEASNDVYHKFNPHEHPHHHHDKGDDRDHHHRQYLATP
jgi:hypothetical protein